MSEQRKPYWVYETTLRQDDIFYVSKQLIHSKAFVELTGAAKQMFFESLMRLKVNSTGSNRQKRGKRFFAENNGQLVMSYKSIYDRYGYSTTTISHGINQLTTRGFWSIVELGCGVKRQSHKIALINNWQDYGTKDFKPGLGKSNKPVNSGFKKHNKLKTTSETKEGTTLETKAVLALRQEKPP